MRKVIGVSLACLFLAAPLAMANPTFTYTGTGANSSGFVNGGGESSNSHTAFSITGSTGSAFATTSTGKKGGASYSTTSQLGGGYSSGNAAFNYGASDSAGGGSGAFSFGGF